MEHHPTDQEIVDYLLCDMAEPEQLRVEESLFTEDDFFERLSAIENRLIDLYVLGKLSESERRRFEEKYLINPRRRAAVDASTRFIGLLDSYRDHKHPAPKPWWRWLASPFRSRNTALQFSLATLLLVALIGCAWLLADRARLKSRTEAVEVALRQKEEELQRQASSSRQSDAEQRSALESVREELKREQERRQINEGLLKQKDEELRASQSRLAGDPTRRAPPASFATLVLSSAVRSVSAPPEELIIRQGDKFVRLIAYLKSSPGKHYRVSLQTVDGEEVWKRTVTKTRPTSDGQQVTVVIPASLFKNKDYFIKLERLAQGGKRANTIEYALSVRDERRQR